MSERMIAALVLFLGFGAPLLHVLASPCGGPFRPPPGSRCPIGPRIGWLVIVLFLGPIGWLMYLRGRGRTRVHNQRLT